MLKISKLADYGSVIMTYLAASNKKHSSRDISYNTKISHPTVTKLLKILQKANFLNSELGSNGGYVLAKPADQITLLDIINAIEGDFALTECSKDITECSVFNSCSISSHWRVINVSVRTALQEVTLSDLVINKSFEDNRNHSNIVS